MSKYLSDFVYTRSSYGWTIGRFDTSGRWREYEHAGTHHEAAMRAAVLNAPEPVAPEPVAPEPVAPDTSGREGPPVKPKKTSAERYREDKERAAARLARMRDEPIDWARVASWRFAESEGWRTTENIQRAFSSGWNAALKQQAKDLQFLANAAASIADTPLVNAREK